MIGKSVLLGGKCVSVNARRSLYPYYHRVMVGPPRQRIPYAEKLFWLGFWATGLLITPAWILVHLDEYKGKK